MKGVTHRGTVGREGCHGPGISLTVSLRGTKWSETDPACRWHKGMKTCAERNFNRYTYKASFHRNVPLLGLRVCEWTASATCWQHLAVSASSLQTHSAWGSISHKAELWEGLASGRCVTTQGLCKVHATCISWEKHVRILKL